MEGKIFRKEEKIYVSQEIINTRKSLKPTKKDKSI